MFTTGIYINEKDLESDTSNTAAPKKIDPPVSTAVTEAKGTIRSSPFYSSLLQAHLGHDGGTQQPFCLSDF